MHIAKSRLMYKFERHFERHIQYHLAAGATCRRKTYIPNIMADGALRRSGHSSSSSTSVASDQLVRGNTRSYYQGYFRG
jgi:hypothetical protein